MENKRLEQETAARQSITPSAPARDYKDALQRSEELHAISPAFRKIPRSINKPSPEQWRDFSQDLSQQLEATDTPYLRTLRDKLAATDAHLLHWFWIILALLVLTALACAVVFSINDSPTAVACHRAFSVSFHV